MLYSSREVKWKKKSSFFPHWSVFSSPSHWYFGRVHVPEVTKCVLRCCGLFPDSATPLIAPAWQCCVWEQARSFWGQHCRDKHFPLPITSSSLQLGNLFIAQLSIFSQAAFGITPCCLFLNKKNHSYYSLKLIIGTNLKFGTSRGFFLSIPLLDLVKINK